jgi:antitoxin (DNA-binding transcriptional repressor) of toxin-antitoxin stability system
MRTVGIKQLKARLSEYLRDVRRGQVFLVTDRDEVVAELGPPRAAAAAAPADPVARVLERLAEDGEVALPRLPAAGWRWPVRGAGLEAGAAARLLDDLRAERGAEES